jgi:hypothetical protein
MNFAALVLTLLAIAAGLGILWVYAKTSNQAALKSTKRKLYASLLELRVFADEPAVSWRAQRSLISGNLRYLALSLKPALWLAVPMTLLLVQLDSFYARAPLPAGRDAIVTMGMAPSWDPHAPPPQLITPPEVQIDGPPVRVVDAREITWRLRPTAQCSGVLRFTMDGRETTCPIEARPGQRYIPVRTSRTALPGVEWIEIRYPDASLHIFGVSVNWIVWFCAVSLLTALLFRKRFGVVL